VASARINEGRKIEPGPGMVPRPARRGVGGPKNHATAETVLAEALPHCGAVASLIAGVVGGGLLERWKRVGGDFGGPEIAQKERLARRKYFLAAVVPLVNAEMLRRDPRFSPEDRLDVLEKIGGVLGKAMRLEDMLASAVNRLPSEKTVRAMQRLVDFISLADTGPFERVDVDEMCRKGSPLRSGMDRSFAALLFTLHIGRDFAGSLKEKLESYLREVDSRRRSIPTVEQWGGPRLVAKDYKRFTGGVAVELYRVLETVLRDPLGLAPRQRAHSRGGQGVVKVVAELVVKIMNVFFECRYTTGAMMSLLHRRA